MNPNIPHAQDPAAQIIHNILANRLYNKVWTNNDLEVVLHAVRTDLARIYNTTNERIASDQAIRQIITRRPLTIQQFVNENIDGFTPEAIRNFAPIFVNVVNKLVEGDLRMTQIMISYDIERHATLLGVQERTAMLARIEQRFTLEQTRQEFGLSLVETAIDFITWSFP